MKIRKYLIRVIDTEQHALEVSDWIEVYSYDYENQDRCFKFYTDKSDIGSGLSYNEGSVYHQDEVISIVEIKDD